MQKFSDATKKGTYGTVFFKKPVSNDPFVRYEKALVKPKAVTSMRKNNGTHLALWAFGVSRFGHIDQAQREANLIKGGNY